MGLGDDVRVREPMGELGDGNHIVVVDVMEDDLGVGLVGRAE